MKLIDKFENALLSDIPALDCELTADDHATKFAKWCRRHQYIYDSTSKSFKELLEIYKEQYGL